MARKDEHILFVLSQVPWWVSICVALLVYVGLKFVIPSIPIENPIIKAVAQTAPRFAWLAVLFLFPAAISVFRSARKRRLVDQQSGIESIRSMPWREFEELLAEAYRRQGYTVKENLVAGPDGGVDLTIRKNGNTYLVQCKQWRNFKVGVKVVREMFGLMTAQNANGVIIVTSGMFTQEAKNFADRKPIDLIEGNQLLELVRNVQARPLAALKNEKQPDGKKCPQCGGDLIVREARRGVHAGEKFWGCSGFPKCKYTEKHIG